MKIYFFISEFWHTPAVVAGKQIYRRIKYIELDANSVVEIKASYQVERIVKTLRENGVIDEVGVDFARFMAAVFLELIAKEMDGKGAQPCTAGAGGSKDDDEEKSMPPKKIKMKKPRKKKS